MKRCYLPSVCFGFRKYFVVMFVVIVKGIIFDTLR